MIYMLRMKIKYVVLVKRFRYDTRKIMVPMGEIPLLPLQTHMHTHTHTAWVYTTEIKSLKYLNWFLLEND